MAFINSHSDEIEEKQLYHVHIPHLTCCLSPTATGSKEKVIKPILNSYFFQDTSPISSKF